MVDKNNNAVVLLSGGMDSTTLLHYVAKVEKCSTIYAISFAYGQKHSKELDMAKWQCQQLSQVVEHKVITLDFFQDLVAGASSLVLGGEDVPTLSELSCEDRKQPSTYVPNRNMILLSLAAAYAESHHCQTVFYGAQAQDEYGYWDCTKEFLAKINAILNLNRKTAISIKAPFIDKSKSAELKIGLELNIDFSHTWTCYRGEEKPCQTCPTCIERKVAFESLNIKDPLIN